MIKNQNFTYSKVIMYVRQKSYTIVQFWNRSFILVPTYVAACGPCFEDFLEDVVSNLLAHLWGTFQSIHLIPCSK